MKSFLFIFLFSFNALATTVAVIDSGVDYKHQALKNNIWVNSVEIADNARDEDGNGYQDDVYGWNFAENNNLVIDYKYLGTFSQDPYKFFEIQARQFLGTLTEEDKAWLKEKRESPEFMKEMGKFGNFIHGTHVAGIAVKDSDAKILSVKLIPTEVKLPGKNKMLALKNMKEESGRMKFLKSLLKALASQQMNLLKEIAAYVNTHKADVANGSFGTGYAQAKTIVGTLYKIVFFKAGTDEELKEPTVYFLNTLVEEGKKMAALAPNTLFVFAAGNDGANNDEYPTSPANIKADNTIAVAATFNRTKLAVFSNYGIKQVDIAAPGVIISSTIPGDEFLKVSGTSQAAPYVANIAAQIKTINKNLTPAQIKKILMGTVDKKDYLVGKVIAEGIVNADRALVAATLSLGQDLEAAINAARVTVLDLKDSKKQLLPVEDKNIFVLPLPSPFSL